jgi:NodT family efflux transporter outer membrane factor (OMF) lipoprotein
MAADDPWWKSFGSSELNRIVDQALGSNFTIQEALARLDQARAMSMEKRSLLLPVITLEAGASHRRTRNPGQGATLDTIALGPAASYEVELGGKITPKTLAGALTARASRSDLETAAMTLAAEVSNTWVDQLAAVNSLDLVKQQLATNTLLLELLELRFENALSTSLDVLQQQEAVAHVTAQIPPLEHEIKRLSNRLCLLQGRPPTHAPPVGNTDFPILTPLPATGIPADLLSKRPDIQAAGFRLMAGQWESRAEQAARLPSLNLTGTLGLQNSGLDTLFNSWILTLGANMAATVFDGGKKAAARDWAEAVVAEGLASYKRTVFTALVEVEDTLSEETHQRAWLAALHRELDAARLALGEATRRYQRGLITFLPLISEQLNVQNLEKSMIVQQAELIKARIALYRSLGGSFIQTKNLGKQK